MINTKKVFPIFRKILLYAIIILLLNVVAFALTTRDEIHKPGNYHFTKNNLVKLDFLEVASLVEQDGGYLILGTKKPITGNSTWLLEFRSLDHQIIWSTQLSYSGFEGLTILEITKDYIFIGIPNQNYKFTESNDFNSSILYLDTKGNILGNHEIIRSKNLYDIAALNQIAGIQVNDQFYYINYAPYSQSTQRITLYSFNLGTPDQFDELKLGNNFNNLLQSILINKINSTILEVMLLWSEYFTNPGNNIPIWQNSFITYYYIDISQPEAQIQSTKNEELYCDNGNINTFCLVFPLFNGDFISIYQSKKLDENYNIRSTLTLNSSIGFTIDWPTEFNDIQINNYFLLDENQLVFGGFGIEDKYKQKVATMGHVISNANETLLSIINLDLGSFITSEITLLKKLSTTNFAIIYTAQDKNATFSTYIQLFSIINDNPISNNSFKYILITATSIIVLPVLDIIRSRLIGKKP